MDFGWTQLVWFGDKRNCQKIKLLTMRPYVKHQQFIVIQTKIGEHRNQYFEIRRDSIRLHLLTLSFFHLDLSVTIQISRPIMPKYRHSVNRQVNAVVPVHQLHTQQPHWWATQD